MGITIIKTKKKMKNKTLSRDLKWKCNFPGLMQEIVENVSSNKRHAIFFQPINLMKSIMCEVSERAIQLNDPILNELMCDLMLYDIPLPGTEEYTKFMHSVRLAAHKQKVKESKKKR